MATMRLRARTCMTLLMFAACDGDNPPELTADARAALAASAATSTWEDLDPQQPGRRMRDPRTGIVFVRVPAGEFEMGGQSVPHEQPVHRVQLKKAFLLAETELTIGQWRRHVRQFAGDPKVPVPEGDDALPMAASWHDASAFCERYGYRLPTEAEWERACRGGHPRGEEPWRDAKELARIAWYAGNADGVRPTGTRAPNPYGLFDMIGNVWEWCADAYSGTAYQRPDPAVDPLVREGDGCVLRGGSWYTAPTARAGTRSAASPFERSPFYGFRPARACD